MNNQDLQKSGRQITINKLEDFVKYFVIEFEVRLLTYHLILAGEKKKSGKYVDAFSAILEKAFSEFAGFPVLALVVTTLAKEIGSKKNIEKNSNNVDLITRFLNDKQKFREELVKAGFDVFQSFEMQFTRVTKNGGSKYAMKQLARDATDRAINYRTENRNASIAECIVLGKSKKSTFMKSGFEIDYKYGPINVKWNTASLYEDVGLVIERNYPEKNMYYEKNDGKSKTDIYGYRRLLSSESWNNLVDKYKLSDLVKSSQFTDYEYILSSKDLEQKSKDILEKINLDEDGLIEERIKKMIEESKSNFIEEMTPFKNAIEKMEANLNNLKVDEFLKEIKLHFEDNKEGEQKIEEHIVAGQEENRKNFKRLRQDQVIYHEDNMKRHKATHERIDVIIDAVTQKDVNNKLVWFDVRGPLTSFTGRQEQLNQISTNIQKGILVITGLDGVGKTELALTYAHKEYDEKDSVIWINASSSEAAKQSFHRLANRLEIRIKDKNGEDKNIDFIVREVYKHFVIGRSLFIFDSAEKYTIIEKFLPLGLPSNVKKPYVLVTSSDGSKWESERVIIKKLPLGDFTDKEAMEFTKKFLKIEDDLQNEDIQQLAKELHNFPLALQQAVAYISETNEEYQVRKLEYKVKDYLNKLSDVEFPPNMDVIPKALKVTLDKITKEGYGQQSLNILNIISYFAPGNIDEKIFLSEFAKGDQDILFFITSLLKKYSIVSFEGHMLRVHGLVQKGRRLELAQQNEEGNVLKEALTLLKKHMKDVDSVLSYKHHIISVWNYAIKYDNLIETFIVNAIDDEKDYTSYFHIIIAGSTFQFVEAIVKKVEENHPNKLREVINAKDRAKGTPLHNAGLNGDEQIMELLIKKGAEINIKKRDTWTPLHLASKNGFLRVVKALLAKGTEVNDTTKYKFTSLHLAALKGHQEIVKVLLDNGADVNAEEEHKYTPLHYAVKYNHFEVVQTLLEDDKINVNAKTGYDVTPLHFAAKEGNTNIFRALIKRGANVNIKDKSHFTPLHSAVQRNHMAVVNDLLTESEIDVNVQTTEGNTPLHLAAVCGNSEVVRALLEKGANLNMKNIGNLTLLRLLEERANGNNKDIGNSSLSSLAGIIYLIKLINDLLRKSEIDVNLQTTKGNTPLDLAAASGNFEAFRILSENGANATINNNGNSTVLLSAALKTLVEVINDLLRKTEIDVNAQTTKANSPLHLVSECCNLEENKDRFTNWYRRHSV